MGKVRKAVKMADIADRLNVSTVTVSKALSGQKGVSEELRAKIREMAVQMGYKPAYAVNPGEEKKSYTIGVILSARYLSDYETFYWKMYQEVADLAIRKECFTMFETVSEEMERTGKLPKLLEERKVDGLIVIGKPGYSYGDILKEKADMPLVFLDFYEQDSNVDCFISDGFYGTYVLTNYLINKGHTRIAYVGTLFSTESITDRYMGYVKALLEHGIEPNKEYLIQDRDVNSGLRDEYGTLTFPKEMPTAFVCNCDFIASLVIKALNERGYRVPEDISVVGYDNYLYPGLSEVEITTYEVDIREMAKNAIRVLLKKLAGEPYKKGIHVVEGHLVEKNSVAERKVI
jgi:LacI family transcriptional regulator/LacI family purine nucleotide synthesis repressor